MGGRRPIGITLVADLLAVIMLAIATAMLLVVLVYAVGHPATEDTRRFFHPTYLVLAAGVSLAFLTGDLFNLFVAFEIMLIASYVLITLGGSEAAGALRYDLRGLQPGVVHAVRDGRRPGLRRHRHREPGRPRRPPPRHRSGDPQRARAHAAHRVRGEGRHLPAVLLAARQLSDGTVAR